MDPITALVLASLLTWGTVGGGIKDTAAILKGQSPPSFAYRTAKLAADERQRKAADALIQRALDSGEPLPAALEPRRIRIKDLVRHWWEDALEDADQWRATRRGTRAERKAARKAWKEKKKALVKKGYDLLKKRVEKRFADPADEDDAVSGEIDPAADGDGDGDGEELPDNVVPLRPKNPDPKPEEDEEAEGGLFGGTTPTPEELDELNRALEQLNDAQAHTATTEGEPQMINLSDAPTLTAHLNALQAYAGYLDKIAADMDLLSAGMRNHEMGDIAVNEVSTAGTANTEAASSIRTIRTGLEQAHTPVSDAREQHTEAADGDYLTRGR